MYGSWKKKYGIQLVKTGSEEVPGEIKKFLNELILLHGLPLNCLLPACRMLPEESIRFFQADWEYITALLYGALSVSGTGEEDSEEYGRIIGQLLDGFRGRDGKLSVLSGFIICSELVEKMADLKVEVFDYSGAAFPILRKERLREDILLVLAKGLIHKAVIRPGGSTAHMGADVTEEGFTLSLRSTDTGQMTGESLMLPWKEGETGLMDLREAACNSGRITPAALGCWLMRPAESGHIWEKDNRKKEDIHGNTQQ